MALQFSYMNQVSFTFYMLALAYMYEQCDWMGQIENKYTNRGE